MILFPWCPLQLFSGFGIISYVTGFSVARCGSWQSSHTFLLLLTRFVLLRKFNLHYFYIQMDMVLVLPNLVKLGVSIV